ncbi:DUF499 domain-containing protein [Rudanella lutea]|uniref:DUF499 domain-containing protein n=1 Tax=Rudanella lutea TaxID=451374 RepID=UPI0003A42743|nr:DUF499 domain-containing protein [Rudanella lutea]
MIPSTTQREQLRKALDLGIMALRPLLVAKMHQKVGDHWPDLFREGLGPEQKTLWDNNRRDGKRPDQLIDWGQLRGFALKNKDLFPELGKKANNLPATFSEITEVRNVLSHAGDLDPVEGDMVMSKLVLLMRDFGMTEAADQVKALKEAAIPLPAPIEGPSTQQPASARAVAKPLPWFTVVRPHDDIRRGRLDESVFAANLSDVRNNTGPDVYLDPAVFFRKTHFTAGLRAIARRVVAGLNGDGDADNRVLSLQTGFGGGKTHALITLNHIATQGFQINDFLPTNTLEVLPNFRMANVAVFTNQTLDAAQGRTTEEGQKIRTIWGELAYQLGGLDAYEIVRQNDEQRTAPAGLFRKILAQTKPALILIDELADYCLKASSQVVGGSTLADQTISFMQELTEAVGASEQTVLVVTLPASRTEMGDSDKAANVLYALQQRVARVGKDTEPVDKEEIFEVIRRRLFDDLGDERIIKAVVDAYADLYRDLGTAIPVQATRSEYKQRLLKSYPFHPELIDLFRLRWASNHNFQRTRGVLRLLASIVSDLYSRQGSLTGTNLLIHPSDVNFANVEAVRSKLKELFGNGFDAVMDADVSGSASNAFKIDEDNADYRAQRLTQGLTATILMGTFGAEGANKGLSVEELKLAFLKPDGFNHNTINTALDTLEENAHYLYYTTNPRRYWFNTKPNINILINQAKHQINEDDAQADIIRRLKSKAQGVSGFNLLVNPDPDNVPEQTALTLVVLGPQFAVGAGAVTGGPIGGSVRAVVERLATKRGSQDRTYRNTLLFLACSEALLGKLRGLACEYLACNRIKDEYGSQLEAPQGRELKEKIDEASKRTEIALAEAYSIALKHTAKEGIKALLVDGTKDSLDTQINSSLMQRLKDESWVLDSIGPLVLQNYNLMPVVGRPVKAKDVYEALLRYDDKVMITRLDVVQTGLLRFCQDGNLAIASGDGSTWDRVYYKESVPFFDVKSDSYWLVDKSTYQAPAPAAPPTANEPGSHPTSPSQPGSGETAGGSAPSQPGTSVATQYRSLKVSGKLDKQNWTQAFNSFINPFRNHNIEIEVTIKVHSTAADPFFENDQRYTLIKESSKQMRLDFEGEGE